MASGILLRLELERHLVNATPLDIVKGKCEGNSRDDLILRREAAFALIGKVEGIPMIAEMLTDKDLFVRRSAAFAFDDLTERLQGRPPQVEATTEITLLLTGELSPDPAKAEIDTVAAGLPDARIVVIEGQQHVADVMAPEIFAGHLLAFLRDEGP